jgi:hypothetical protein
MRGVLKRLPREWIADRDLRLPRKEDRLDRPVSRLAEVRARKRSGMLAERSRIVLPLAILAQVVVSVLAVHAQERALPSASADGRPTPRRLLLTAEQWKRLDHAVDRGLAYLATTQNADGTFPTTTNTQPGITSLAVMAFLARGHQPGKGPYGARIERAVDYILSRQDSRSGAITPDGFDVNETTNYCHGISGVMLAEIYGMTSARRQERIRGAIVRALAYTRRQQVRPKRFPEEAGGWRYLAHGFNSNEADLSATAWQLMFYRAARNAEFKVPPEWVKEAMGYVHRSFDAKERGFVYALSGGNRYVSRAMVGAGIVCLAQGGEHQSETAKEAGEWVLRNSFEPYNTFRRPEDRYHYGAFYCSQAMFQLGGDYWHRFFPTLLDVLARAQHENGSWDNEAAAEDLQYGKAYTTALAILALAPPYQILPIYQR